MQAAGHARQSTIQCAHDLLQLPSSLTCHAITGSFSLSHMLYSLLNLVHAASYSQMVDQMPSQAGFSRYPGVDFQGFYDYPW